MHAKHHSADRSRKMHADEPLKCVIDVDTSSAPPTEQYDLYRSWNSSLADVELLGEEGYDTFAARQRVWQLGDVGLVVADFPKDYRRLWRLRQNSAPDHRFLGLELSRSRDVGDSVGVRARQLRLGCLAVPEEHVSESDITLALFLPRHSAITQLSKTEVRKEAENFLTDYLILLHRALPQLRVKDAPHIAAATTSLLAACLSPSRDQVVEAQHAIDAVNMERASKIITKKLADRSLTSHVLCRELGVSRSSLYRIFEPVGGVSNYIRRRRLLKTRDILADSSDRRAISSIAEEWGFMDPSIFSRMFRKEFGITPKEARAEGWQGAKHATWLPISQPADGAHTLISFLLSSY